MPQTTDPSLTLSWGDDNTATLEQYGLVFTVSDETGEDPYRGFYWREESENRAHGNFSSPQEACEAAQMWVLRELPRMAFLLEVTADEAAEENVPAAHYLLFPGHLPMLSEDGIHDGICLVGKLGREGALPRRFASREGGCAYARAAGLALHTPATYGLE